MADFNLPSSSDLQRLSYDPRTASLAEIPNAIEGSLNLAEVMKQKQLQRKVQEEKLRQAVAQHLNEVKLGKAAAVTPTTPISSEVPAANVGNIAAVSPDTGTITQTGTQQFQSDLRRQLAATEPKEFAKGVIKEQMTAAKPQPWKTVGTTKTPDGKSHAVQQNQAGEYRTVEVPEGTELTAEMYPKVRLAQTVGNLNKDLVDSLSLTKAPDAIKRINNTLAGIVRFKPLEQFAADKGLTPQELVEISRNVDAIVSATGRPTVTITKELLPKTLKGKYSSIEQFFQSKPSPQDYKEFLDRWQELRKRETPKLEQYVKNYQSQIASSKGEWIREYAPQVYERTLKAYGLKPSDIAKSVKSGTSTSMFPSDLFGGSNPEDKLNELKSQGLSDDEAYYKIAEEEASAGEQ